MKLRGRAVSPGHGTGPALVSAAPVSFLGGIDGLTGVVRDPSSDVQGRSITGQAFVFPHGKGSTVGSYVLYGLAKRGRGPAAIVNGRTEAVVATGSILGGVPLVDLVDVSLFVTGDSVTVDGDRGIVEIAGVHETPVVTAFLENGGRILVLRRGPTASTFPSRWSGVSGIVEGSERPLSRAKKEIREETDIADVRLRARGPIVYVRHGTTAFAVHPLLFHASTRRVRLDAENDEFRWVRPDALAKLPTVPRLREAYDAVAAVARRGGR